MKSKNAFFAGILYNWLFESDLKVVQGDCVRENMKKIIL